MRKILFYLTLAAVLVSCTPTEKLKYVIPENNLQSTFNSIRSEKKIEPYDYLYIKLYSLDPNTSSIFSGGQQSYNTNEKLQSYEVNESGYISFPFVGNIEVKDLTIDEAREKLEKELNKYLSNVSLRVRFVGNQIILMGELNRPGSYSFYDEKITVFQALSYGGDISVYGDKTSVALIREKDNVVKYAYLDLTDKSIVESEYYYLQPNDILLVNPIKQKYRSLQDRSMIYLILSIISILSTTL